MNYDKQQSKVIAWLRFPLIIAVVFIHNSSPEIGKEEVSDILSSEVWVGKD